MNASSTLTQPDPLVKGAYVRQRCAIHATTMTRWIKDEVLPAPAKTIGGRHYWLKSVIDGWVEKNLPRNAA